MNNGLADAAELDSEITPTMRAILYVLVALSIMIQVYVVVKRYRDARRKVAMVEEIHGEKMGVMLRLCARFPPYHGYIHYEADPNYAPFHLDNPPEFFRPHGMYYEADPNYAPEIISDDDTD